MSSSVQLLMLAAVFLGFWLIVVRPQRQRQRAVAAVQAELAPGQQVITTAGIYGTIEAVHEGRIDLEIAPGTVITLARQAVVHQVEDEVAPEEADGELGDADLTHDDAATGTTRIDTDDQPGPQVPPVTGPQG